MRLCPQNLHMPIHIGLISCFMMISMDHQSILIQGKVVRVKALVAKEVMPSMRERGQGSFLISNNAQSLRGRKRMTGQSLYYPRVMMRTLAQVLTEEYSEYGVHVANVVIDGTIDSPGTRAMPAAQKNPELIINPVKIAEAFYYLHTQDKSCWTHELQLTPYPTKPSF